MQKNDFLEGKNENSCISINHYNMFSIYLQQNIFSLKSYIIQLLIPFKIELISQKTNEQWSSKKKVSYGNKCYYKLSELSLMDEKTYIK